MKLFRNGDWGLKLLALILAIVVYHVLKNETLPGVNHEDKSIFQR